MSDCKRCGFCCQIHMTKVGPADAELISHRRGFKKIVPHNGGQWAVMKIPCKHLAGKLCRIYSNKRPKLCGTFPEPMFLELWAKIHPNCGFVEAWKAKGGRV